MVLVQNKYKSTLVGVLRAQMTFVTHSSPSCYVTLRTQVNSGNLGPQKPTRVFLLLYCQFLLSIAFKPRDKKIPCHRARDKANFRQN